MAILVASIEEDFVKGEDGIVVQHTFPPGGFGGTGAGPEPRATTAGRGTYLLLRARR